MSPEDSRINVFNRGIWRGLNGMIPLGGQFIPNSTVGDSLEWKNPQKNEMKKNTSDVINRIIPHRSPIVTINVCIPCRVLSRTMSRHHWYMISLIDNSPIIRRFTENAWNHLINPIIVDIALNAPRIGHGLTSTRWNGWFLCIDIKLLLLSIGFLILQIHMIG